MNRLFAVAALLALAACVPTPEDPIDFGTLCVPSESECSSSTVLERDVSGRNQIDYVVENMGTNAVVVEVLALVPSAEYDPASTINEDDIVARRQHDSIAVSGKDENRFTAQDLGVRDSIRLAARCASCDVVVEWVFASVPRECFEEDDCPATWQCDETAGRCVECLAHADCNDDQRCDFESGRCDPPDTTAGCSTVSGGSELAAVLFFALGLLVLRVRRRWAPAVLLALLLWPASSAASPPRASVAVAAGARILSGELGEVTKRGVGLSVLQELRWRYVGMSLSLGTSYFLTTQEPPPFSRSFQTYGVSVGPRGYLPIGRFELVAGADYRRMGTANNSLIRLTGPRTSFDAVGGIAGIRARLSGLEARIETGVQYVVQLEAAMVSADLAIGFTNMR